MIDRPFLRVADVAPLLGVTSGRVYQLIAAGEIPAVRVGRSLRVPRAALDAWVERCTAEARRNARLAASKRADAGVDPVSSADLRVGVAVREFVQSRPCGWRGSASELLAGLLELRTSREADDQTWPDSARSLSSTLRRLVRSMERDGIRVALGRRGHRGKRLISLSHVAGENRAPSPSRTAPAPQMVTLTVSSHYAGGHEQLRSDSVSSVSSPAGGTNPAKTAGPSSSHKRIDQRDDEDRMSLEDDMT